MKRFVAVPTQVSVLILVLALACPSISSKAIADTLENPTANEQADPFGPSAAPSTSAEAKPEPALVVAPKQPRIWVDPSDATDEVRILLQQPLTSGGLEFQDASLEEVVGFLRGEYKFEIYFDAQGLDDLGLSADETVSVNLRNISLNAALRLMLKPLELTYYVSDNCMVITSERKARLQLKVAVYPVADLIAGENGSYDCLLDLISSTVASDSWADNGGGEAEIREYPQREALVISQTGAVHDEVLALLTALRKCEVCLESTERPEVVRMGGGSGGVGRSGMGVGFRGGKAVVSREVTSRSTPARGGASRGGRAGARTAAE